MPNADADAGFAGAVRKSANIAHGRPSLRARSRAFTEAQLGRKRSARPRVCVLHDQFQRAPRDSHADGGKPQSFLARVDGSVHEVPETTSRKWPVRNGMTNEGIPVTT